MADDGHLERILADGVAALEAGVQVPSLDMTDSELRLRLVIAETGLAELREKFARLEAANARTNGGDNPA
jgi:hypothetical protein